MSIEKSNGYKTSDGLWFIDIAAAKRAELATILDLGGDSRTSAQVVVSIVEHAEQVIDILRYAGRKPRAKKVKVGRPRKVKVAVGDESSAKDSLL